VDSNGTESTEIEEDAQEDPELKSPAPTSASELTSPDIEISSPRSMTSVSFLVELDPRGYSCAYRNDLRSIRSFHLARDLTLKTMHHSRSSMSRVGSKTSEKVIAVEHLPKPINHRLLLGLPRLRRLLRAPITR
jgi:hypothetical protein